MISFLLNAACYNLGEQDENVTGMEAVSTGSISINNGAPAPPMCYGRNMTFPRQNASYGLRHELPAVVTEGENYRLPGEHQQENNVCGDGHLSGIMPDVAMATASFGALQLVEQQELELDLGDGTSHLLQHGPVSIGTIGPHHPLLPHQRQRHFPGPPPPPYMYHRSSSGLPRFI